MKFIIIIILFSVLTYSFSFSQYQETELKIKGTITSSYKQQPLDSVYICIPNVNETYSDKKGNFTLCLRCSMKKVFDKIHVFCGKRGYRLYSQEILLDTNSIKYVEIELKKLKDSSKYISGRVNINNMPFNKLSIYCNNKLINFSDTSFFEFQQCDTINKIIIKLNENYHYLKNGTFILPNKDFININIKLKEEYKSEIHEKFTTIESGILNFFKSNTDIMLKPSGEPDTIYKPASVLNFDDSIKVNDLFSAFKTYNFCSKLFRGNRNLDLIEQEFYLKIYSFLDNIKINYKDSLCNIINDFAKRKNKEKLSVINSLRNSGSKKIEVIINKMLENFELYSILCINHERDKTFDKDIQRTLEYDELKNYLKITQTMMGDNNLIFKPKKAFSLFNKANIKIKMKKLIKPKHDPVYINKRIEEHYKNMLENNKIIEITTKQNKDSFLRSFFAKAELILKTTEFDIIDIGDTFEYNSELLTDFGKKKIDSLIVYPMKKLILNYSNKFKNEKLCIDYEITGYADSKGGARYNENLGMKRSRNLSNYITRKLYNDFDSIIIVAMPYSKGEWTLPSVITQAESYERFKQTENYHLTNEILKKLRIDDIHSFVYNAIKKYKNYSFNSSDFIKLVDSITDNEFKKIKEVIISYFPMFPTKLNDNLVIKLRKTKNKISIKLLNDIINIEEIKTRDDLLKIIENDRLRTKHILKIHSSYEIKDVERRTTLIRQAIFLK